MTHRYYPCIMTSWHGHAFCITGHLWAAIGGFSPQGGRWCRTLMLLLLCYPDQNADQTVTRLMIWDAMTLVWLHPTVFEIHPFLTCRIHFCTLRTVMYFIYLTRSITKYAHCFCIVLLCCGNVSNDLPMPSRMISLACRQSHECPIFSE